MIALVLVLLASAFAPVAAPRGGTTPPPAEPLRLADGVRDPVLALLLGIVDDDRRGVFTRERILDDLSRSGRESRVPLDAFGSLIRVPVPGHPDATEVRAVFRGRGEIPIPYDILGYRPGKLRSSPTLILREWHLGEIRMEVPDAGGRRGVVTLSDVVVWGIVDGSFEIDIDGWIDALLGSKLDDTRIVGIAVFTRRGERIGMAMGYNRARRGHSGAFSLGEDRILFPVPDEFKAIGRALRSRVESLTAGARRG